MKNFVPVVDLNRKPLMPTSGKNARKMIEKGDATPFWSHGVFCIRLNREPYDRKMQEVVVGVDPGSKREGYSVRSEKHDYLNIDANAKDWVGKKLENRRILRRSRRSRKTPNRSPKPNNYKSSKLPGGTRARWEEKLRVLNWLNKLFPISHVIVEDTKAISLKGKRKWNMSFGPLQLGKTWFYNKIKEKWELTLVQGYETKEIRDSLGLKKNSNKLAESFDTHCVDSWAMTTMVIDGESPKHKRFLRLIPIQRQRRNLHLSCPSKGGVRKLAGGTNKGGLKTGTLVKHKNGNFYYTGGIEGNSLHLHDLNTGKRNKKSIKRNLIIFCPLSWRFYNYKDQKCLKK